MRIGFINFTPFVYSVDTPIKEPLGGSESSMCYLAAELARIGHEVILFGRTQNETVIQKVRHLNEKLLDSKEIKELDVLIVQNTPRNGFALRQLLKPNSKLIFWSGHKPDESPINSLGNPSILNSYDAFVFVSDWQKGGYLKKYTIDPKKCVVLKNAISPAFENLFKKTNSILSIKPKNPVLAYITIPQRGLDVLLDIFPQIKARFPKIILKVFSSMKVYQAQETEKTLELYDRCKKMKGVEYIGSIPQTDLAKEMKNISILSYPSIVPETSCIGLMEAMAAGCIIVTSNLGALPDTSAGFANLVKITTDRDRYCRDYSTALEKTIEKFYNPENNLEEISQKEVNYANKNYTWEPRAKQWEQLLINL